MAMFDKHKGSKQTAPAEPAASKPSPGVAPPPVAERVAMIGKGITISGDVTAESNLMVEGLVEGRSIQSTHDVEIAESGKVVAGISAKVVRIAGEVTGDVNGSEKVLIAKTGRVQGNLVAPRIQLEDGAVFRGSVDMTPAPAAEPRPAVVRNAPVDAPAKPEAAAPRSSGAAAGDARKEPGLTLKSG